MKGLKTVYGLQLRRMTFLPLKLLRPDGLRENTKQRSSRTLTMTSEGLLTPVFAGVAREINFYLSLNRHGRMLLDHLEERASSGLWPRFSPRLQVHAT
jgi:hypothetical protein